jgi:hypothetical protein
MATEVDLYKLVERLIDEIDAVPSLTAAMIADEAMLLADPDGSTEALVRVAAHAQFQLIAAEILDRRFGGKGDSAEDSSREADALEKGPVTGV